MHQDKNDPFSSVPNGSFPTAKTRQIEQGAFKQNGAAGWAYVRHYDPIQGHGNDRSPRS